MDSFRERGLIALLKDSDKSDSRAILKLEQNVRSMLRLGTNNADRRFYLSAFHHPLDGRWTFVLRLDDLATPRLTRVTRRRWSFPFSIELVGGGCRRANPPPRPSLARKRAPPNQGRRSWHGTAI